MALALNITETFNNAILDNQIEQVKDLLANNSKYATQLIQIEYNIFAKLCCKGYLDIVKFIIDYQYNNLCNNQSNENNANENKSANEGKMLIHHYSDYNDIILEVAKNGHLDVIQFLFEISEKFNKDYYRLRIIENIIINALQNNHSEIADWIFNNIYNYQYNNITLNCMMKSMFQECIINNANKSVKFIYEFYYKQLYDNANDNANANNIYNVNGIENISLLENNIKILKTLAKAVFYVYNIRLELPMLQFIYNTFMESKDIEKNDNKLIRTIFAELDNYINTLRITLSYLITPSRISSRINTIIREKLIWFDTLSNTYEITYSNNIPKLSVKNPILSAIRNNDILEACNLLNISQIEPTPEYIDENNNQSLWKCNICLDMKRHSIITKCNHKFCLECIYEWVIQNDNVHCPYCRDNIILAECKFYN